MMITWIDVVIAALVSLTIGMLIAHTRARYVEYRHQLEKSERKERERVGARLWDAEREIANLQDAFSRLEKDTKVTHNIVVVIEQRMNNIERAAKGA